MLAAEGVSDAKIDLALVDDRTMRELHRRYLGLDSPTDVLTFPMAASGEPLAGQIVISVETALRQAKRYKMQPATEVLLYFVHGMLHLCGYDDQTRSSARRMRRRQMKLLKMFDSRNPMAGTYYSTVESINLCPLKKG